MGLSFACLSATVHIMSEGYHVLYIHCVCGYSGGIHDQAIVKRSRVHTGGRIKGRCTKCGRSGMFPTTLSWHQPIDNSNSAHGWTRKKPEQD